ncbi:MAG: hypothetical protein AB7L90_13620 [Hyphomicrobiaceae bacterium]
MGRVVLQAEALCGKIEEFRFQQQRIPALAFDLGQDSCVFLSEGLGDTPVPYAGVALIAIKELGSQDLILASTVGGDDMRQSYWAIMAATLSLSTPHIARADADLFKERCAKCHARASLLAANLKGQTRDDKAAALDAFLKTHHADDGQVRAKIIAYLMNPAGK